MMFMAVAFVLTIVGFVVGCLWLCCCDPRSEKEYDSLPQNDGDEAEDQKDFGNGQTDMGGLGGLGGLVG